MTHQFNLFEAFQTPANLLSSFLNSVQKWNHTYINLNQLIYSSCGKLFRWNTSWLIFLMRATCEEIYLWLGLESSLTQHIFVVSFELCTDSKWKNLFESELLLYQNILTLDCTEHEINSGRMSFEAGYWFIRQIFENNVKHIKWPFTVRSGYYNFL